MSQTFYWDNNVMTWLVDRYPIPKLHELVDSQIQNGHLKVCEHVYDEAMGSPAKSWVMQRRDEVLVPMTTEILVVLRDVLEHLPRLYLVLRILLATSPVSSNRKAEIEGKTWSRINDRTLPLGL